MEQPHHLLLKKLAVCVYLAILRYATVQCGLNLFVCLDDSALLSGAGFGDGLRLIPFPTGAALKLWSSIRCHSTLTRSMLAAREIRRRGSGLK